MTKKPIKPKFGQDVFDEICNRLADGESLRAICRTKGMPDERTVRRWAADEEHAFSPQYARAREIGYLKLADEILEISDDGSNDWMLRSGKGEGGDEETSGYVLNGEHVQRSRLRIDSRKWLLSKMLPKVFGDKVVNEHTGKDGQPISHSVEVNFIQPKG